VKFELPKLFPGESFSHEILRDEDGEIEGVLMKFQNSGFKIEEIVDVEQAYYAKFDMLRARAQALIEELRKTAKEKD